MGLITAGPEQEASLESERLCLRFYKLHTLFQGSIFIVNQLCLRKYNICISP